MGDVAITGGSVLTAEGVIEADVVVRRGRIAEIGTGLSGDEIIDATGAWVGPGFVDLHAHLREPGEEWKEDIASGSAAAAAGGYTAVVAMPNTEPPTDAGHLARYVAERGREIGLVDVHPAGCISMGRKGERLAHLDQLVDAGVRVFTDDGDSVADAALLRQAMDYLAARDGVIAQHAVDRTLAGSGFMHEGAVSSRLGMYGIPAAAETIVIARDLELAALTGCRYHVQHVAAAAGIDMIAAAKERGLAVTAEVTPHHLMFDDNAVAGADPAFKMMPPLRTAADREALVRALRAGIIDVVATDHAPHASHEKDVPFEHAPNGVTGLEWAASIVSTVAGLEQRAFFERLSVAPAAIAGLDRHGRPLAVGDDANLVVFDPALEWVPTTTRSRSWNAPYFGLTFRGKVVATMLRGRVTARAEFGVPA
jgi:dihydroorotase